MKEQIKNKKKYLLLTALFGICCVLGLLFLNNETYLKVLECGTCLICFIEIVITQINLDKTSIQEKIKQIIIANALFLVCIIAVIFCFIVPNTSIGTVEFQLLMTALFLMGVSIETSLLQILVSTRFLTISFVYILLSSSLVYIFTMPISMAPDEIVHYFTAYHVSNVMMGVDDSECKEDGQVMMRTDDTQYGFQALGYTEDSVVSYLSSIDDPLVNDELIEYGWGTMYGNEYLFVPCGLGITVGRILGLGTTATMVLGRLFNLLFYVTLTTIALKIIPFGKSILLVVSTMAMALQQGMSYSYDCVINASAFLVVAMGLNWYENREERLKWWQIIFGSIFIAVLFKAKGHAYAAIALIPILLLIARCIKIPEKKFSKIVTATTLGIVVFGAVCLVGLILFGNDHLMAETSNILGYIDANSYTIPYLINHPTEIVTIAYATLRLNSILYISTFIGQYMGWLEVTVPNIVILLELILLIIVIFFSEKKRIQNSNRIIMLFLSVISIICVFVGLLLSWTPIDAGYVLGVQGRYFIAIAIPLFLGVGGLIKKELGINKIFVIQSCIILLTTFSMINWFFR